MTVFGYSYFTSSVTKFISPSSLSGSLAVYLSEIGSGSGPSFLRIDKILSSSFFQLSFLDRSNADIGLSFTGPKVTSF